MKLNYLRDLRVRVSYLPTNACHSGCAMCCQRCMMGIFSDLLEKVMEVFMDDFFIFGESFDACLQNLKLVLERCEEKHLVLN